MIHSKKQHKVLEVISIIYKQFIDHFVHNKKVEEESCINYYESKDTSNR